MFSPHSITSIHTRSSQFNSIQFNTFHCTLTPSTLPESDPDSYHQDLLLVKQEIRTLLSYVNSSIIMCFFSNLIPPSIKCYAISGQAYVFPLPSEYNVSEGIGGEAEVKAKLSLSLLRR